MAKKAVVAEAAAVESVESNPKVPPVTLSVEAVLHSKKYCRLVPRFVLKTKLLGKLEVTEEELNTIISEYIERR